MRLITLTDNGIFVGDEFDRRAYQPINGNELLQLMSDLLATDNINTYMLVDLRTKS